MNCREAHSLISAERDGALDNSQRATLEGHLAACGTCRRARDELTAGLTTWRTEVARASVPDAEREWHAVRRRIRGGSEAGSAASRRTLFTWLALPLGAAAAAAIAFMVLPGTPSGPSLPTTVAHTARVDSVEAPGSNASTMVFVDDKSGWVIVWADANPKSG